MDDRRMELGVVGITGGIGSGKSVISRILRLSGHKVYDCDYEAKQLMSSSGDIKCRIRDEISAEVTDGLSEIDRQELSRIVFADESQRLRLNVIVHGAVREDIKRRISEERMVQDKRGTGVYFIESAILAESGLAAICDRIWVIDGGEESERISRVVARDGAGADQVQGRIRAQDKEKRLLEEYEEKTEVIANHSGEALLPQIDRLLKNKRETC